jgi:hypothetical protein
MHPFFGIDKDRRGWDASHLQIGDVKLNGESPMGMHLFSSLVVLLLSPIKMVLLVTGIIFDISISVIKFTF